jgi:hypothetical protein
MPEDKSRLETGFHQAGTLAAPDGPRRLEFEVTDDSDYAQMAAISDDAEEQLAQVPRFARHFVEKQMHEVVEQMADGKWDENSMINGAMEKSTKDGLEKLKQLGES